MATETNIAEISALDYEGRGVAKVGGKTIFIKGALLGLFDAGLLQALTQEYLHHNESF